MRSGKESGFNLIEMAIVVMIIGLLMAGSMYLLKPYLEMSQANLTTKKMENISLALASFAQNYGRLPCPADAAVSLTATSPPYGFPVNSGTNGDRFAENNCGTTTRSHIGIVPFSVLGLTEDQVRDNYGNLITYAVSAAMVEYNFRNTTGNVNNTCRIDKKWVEAAVNKNLFKARVCCADRQPSTTKKDILITTRKNGAGAQVFTPAATRGSGDYGNPNTAVTAPIANPGTNRFIAFVLVSHGQNGDGAFIEQPTAGNEKHAITANAAAEESENRDDDLDFTLAPIIKTDNADYFDDILVWKTNDQLISAFGNDSCVRP